ncbi:MAG TPA: alcohol dehydrogenase catalytic domain-containing protein [Acidimicrobiales bacterium]
MKGVVWKGARAVVLAEDLERPELRDDGDAIVRVTRSAICGTDLHPYRGEIPGFLEGTVLGHEFVGVVEEVGPAVTGLRPGDRVVASDVVACGRCWWCRRGWHYQCEQVTLFGYGEVVGPYLPGGQAEYVRSPFADVVLAPIPDGLSDEQALFVGDILTTGFTAASEAGIRPGDVVAVVGCGPVGLFATMSARYLGAAVVLAVDPDPARRAAAEAAGARPVAPGDLAAALRDATAGRGADVVLEAVGSDAALACAIEAVRAKGTVVAVGAHHSPAFPLHTGTAFGKELTLRWAVGDPISTRDQLLPILLAGRIDATSVITHRMPLDDAVAAYDRFDRREATKVVLEVS